MSPAIAFITSLKRREFIGDIYLHSKKIENGQNIFCDWGHGGRKNWYHKACNHSNRLHHQSASQPKWAWRVLPPPQVLSSCSPLNIHSSFSISPASVVICILLFWHSPDKNLFYRCKKSSVPSLWSSWPEATKAKFCRPPTMATY